MKIYAARRDDVNEGFVWLKRPGLPSRSIVRIKNPASGKRVYCEALQIDENFLREYNRPPRLAIHSPESAVVMSGWFRTRLGNLATQQDYPLDVVVCGSWWAKLRACMHHPQIVVRVAVWLGVLSVGLGVLGVILSVWPRKA